MEAERRGGPWAEPLGEDWETGIPGPARSRDWRRGWRAPPRAPSPRNPNCSPCSATGRGRGATPGPASADPRGFREAGFLCLPRSSPFLGSTTEEGQVDEHAFSSNIMWQIATVRSPGLHTLPKGGPPPTSGSQQAATQRPSAAEGSPSRFPQSPPLHPGRIRCFLTQLGSQVCTSEPPEAHRGSGKGPMASVGVRRAI